MSATFKVLLAAFLFAGVFTQNRTCEHLGFGQANWHDATIAAESKVDFMADEVLPNNAPLSARLTALHTGQLRDGGGNEEIRASKPQFVNQTASSTTAEEIEVDWRVLINIEYKLRYFEELGMEMYSPVFTDAVKELHGKEVVIEGFVIPFDEAEELLSLSFNPYASCFFCGKASPASVISMYLKDNRKRYKIDDFLKFKGTLYLNQDDPNEFYYILRDAEEQK
ncbi:MAG: hypothetical protein HRU41_29690 [Saprospiraceae bacterium]|nr:hypothetical protein [Saprospiraceae bacterium]